VALRTQVQTWRGKGDELCCTLEKNVPGRGKGTCKDPGAHEVCREREEATGLWGANKNGVDLAQCCITQATGHLPSVSLWRGNFCFRLGAQGRFGVQLCHV
jgi:hypothetical protein